jgi:hypothetical protein
MRLGSFGLCGKNGGKEKMGEPTVVRGGGERPAMVCRWWGNDGVVWMWCLEVFGGRRDGDGEKKGVRRWVEGMRKGEEQ